MRIHARLRAENFKPGSRPATGFRLWFGPRLKAWSKAISILAVLSFELPYFTFAFDATTYNAESSRTGSPSVPAANSAALGIPNQFGRIVDRYQGRSGKQVVFIHDLHCNYEVQSNIAGILKALAQQHGLHLVGIEGESGPLSVAPLATFPIEEVKENTGQYFLKRGRITGAEYLAATSRLGLQLEGIESEALYLKNKDILFKFLNEESQGFSDDLRGALEALKVPLYTVELAKLDHLREQYAFENMTLASYCNALLKEAERSQVSLAGFPVLERYAAEHRLPESQDADYDQLLRDAKSLDRTLREKLYVSEDQRLLDHYLDLLAIMENMINISATAAELDYYRSHRAEFSVARVVQFIDQTAYRNAMDPGLDAGVIRLQEYLDLAAKFYEVADQRSRAFVNNLLRLMDARQQDMAAMIIGGFHSELVEKALREHGVSFVAVKPRITRAYAENPYFSLLQGKRAPLEKLLAQKENIFAPTSAFSDKVFQLYLDTVLKINLYHYYRVERGLTGDALESAYAAAIQEYKDNLADIAVDFSGYIQGNPERDIYVFHLKNTSFSVILRRSDTLGLKDYPYPLLAQEDLGNGYKFQIIENEVLNGRSEGVAVREILMGQDRRRVALADVKALQATGPLAAWVGRLSSNLAATGVRAGRLRASLAAFFTRVRPRSPAAVLKDWWAGLGESFATLPARLANLTPAAVTAGLVASGFLLAASFALTLPVSGPLLLLQSTLTCLLLLFGFLLMNNQRTPMWARQAAGITVSLVASFMFFQLAPWVNQVVASLNLRPGGPVAAATTPGIGNAAGRVNLAVIPVVGLVANWFGMGRGRGIPTIPYQDIIADALLYADRQGFLDLDQPIPLAMKPSRDTFRGYLENILAAVTSLESAADQQALRQACSTPAGLAQLGMAYHQGGTRMLQEFIRRTPGEDLTAESYMLDLARDGAAAEALADSILQPRPWRSLVAFLTRRPAPVDVPAELITGHSHLAELLRAANAGRTTWVVGGQDFYRPERMLPEALTPRQVQAMARIAQARGMQLVLTDPTFNPILGFVPKAEEAVNIGRKIIDLARALGATVTLHNNYAQSQQTALQQYARAGESGPAVSVAFAGTAPEVPAEVAAAAVPGAVAEMQRERDLGIQPAGGASTLERAAARSTETLQALPAAATQSAPNSLALLPSLFSLSRRLGRFVRQGVFGGIWAGMNAFAGAGLVWMVTLAATGEALRGAAARNLINQLARRDQNAESLRGLMSALSELPGPKNQVRVEIQAGAETISIQASLPEYILSSPLVLRRLLRTPGLKVFNADGQRLNVPRRWIGFGSAA